MTRTRVLKYSLFLSLSFLFTGLINSEKAGIENEPRKTEEMTLYMGGSINGSMADSCFRTMNESRQVKLIKGTLIGSDFQMQIERRSPGYIVRLEKDGRVIQLARAMKDYELPLAAAALARDHIPDGVNRSAAIRDRF